MSVKSRYKEILGSEAKKLFECSKKKYPKAIRINTLKISDKELVKRLKLKNCEVEKIGFLDHGYYVKSKHSLGSRPEYLFGYYYLQEAAAQLPAEILNPGLGDTVLDICAAPGGKTTHLAQLMKNKGMIVAIDVEGRTEALVNNIERMGVYNTAVYMMDGMNVKKLGLKFDKVLLDAPCSGNLCQDRSWMRRRRETDFLNRSKLQKELLDAAWSVLKPSGTLLYSTCSLEPEENEFVIDYAIKNLKARVEPVNLSIGDAGLAEVFGMKLDKSVKNCVRLWPHKTGTQGFFVAKLRKN